MFRQKLQLFLGLLLLFQSFSFGLSQTVLANHQTGHTDFGWWCQSEVNNAILFYYDEPGCITELTRPVDQPITGFNNGVWCHVISSGNTRFFNGQSVCGDVYTSIPNPIVTGGVVLPPGAEFGIWCETNTGARTYYHGTNSCPLSTQTQIYNLPNNVFSTGVWCYNTVNDTYRYYPSSTNCRYAGEVFSHDRIEEGRITEPYWSNDGIWCRTITTGNVVFYHDTTSCPPQTRETYEVQETNPSGQWCLDRNTSLRTFHPSNTCPGGSSTPSTAPPGLGPSEEEGIWCREFIGGSIFTDTYYYGETSCPTGSTETDAPEGGFTEGVWCETNAGLILFRPGETAGCGALDEATPPFETGPNPGGGDDDDDDSPFGGDFEPADPFSAELPENVALENVAVSDLIECAANEEDNQQSTRIMCQFIRFVNFLSMGVVVVSSITVGVAGYMYMTSRGDPNKTNQAIKRIIQVGLAIVMYVFGWALLNWLVPGGVFR